PVRLGPGRRHASEDRAREARGGSIQATAIQPVAVEAQVAILWAVQNGYLDEVAVDRIEDFQAKLADYLSSRKTELMTRIANEKALSDALTNDLKTAVAEFKQTYR